MSTALAAIGFFVLAGGRCQARFLKRQLSLPVSMMSQ
jgi:hypothetical protein